MIIKKIKFLRLTSINVVILDCLFPSINNVNFVAMLPLDFKGTSVRRFLEKYVEQCCCLTLRYYSNQMTDTFCGDSSEVFT